MKATYKFVIAALAATLALASCTKETAEPGIADSATKGVRTIAVSFGNSTKSSLWDGPTPLTPTFKIDDEICVAQADGEAEPQTCKVKLGEGGILVIETNLEGELEAVYPATAAAISEDGKSITGVNVPTLQSGTFAEANICQATIPAGSSNAEFKNKVSILKFYVDASIEVLGLRITAAEEFELVVQSDINVKSASSSIPPLYTSTDDPSKRISYVAVSPKVYENFTVSSYTTTQDAYENMAVVKEFGDVTFAEGTIYNVFIPYYIKVFVGTDENGDDFQYWSYCNLGAFLPEEPGLYFAWGDTQGHRWDANSNQFEGGHSFIWANCPFNGGSEDFSSTAFEAAKATAFPSGTLVLAHDAANVNWGGKWRMPTGTEFGVLVANLSKDWDNTNKGCKVYDKSAKTVFFPAASYGFGTSLYSTNFFDGSYWSSSLKPDDDQSGQILYINPTADGLAESNSAYRFVGYPIRPIYDETLSDGGDPVALTNNPYTNGGTF